MVGRYTLPVGMLRTRPVVSRAGYWKHAAEATPLTKRVGPRIFLLAALACFAVFEPSRVTTLGPFIATVIFLTGRPGKLRLDLPNIMALALATWALASSLWSMDAYFSMRVGLNYLAMAVIFIAARDAVRSVAQLRTVVLGYLVGCFVLAGKVILEARQGNALGDGRLNLEGLNINYAGYAFAVGFAMILLLWVTVPLTLRRKAIISCTLAALILGVYLSDTRGAFIGLAFLVLWLLICAFCRTRPPLKMLVLAVLVTTWAIATGAFDRASLAVESFFGRETGDWSGRLIIWPIAREDWAEHFLFGGGASTFFLRGTVGVGAHNLILELGTGLGLVGVILYLLFLWSSLGKRPTAAGEKLGPVLIGSFIAVSAFSYLTGHWELSPAAWIALAVFSRIGLLGGNSAVQRRTAA